MSLYYLLTLWRWNAAATLPFPTLDGLIGRLMGTTEAELVEIIKKLGECRKRLMHFTVAHAVDDAFNQAVEALLNLRAATAGLD
jgi:hypothetical protein